MSDLPPDADVDPDVLHDLQTVEEARALFASLGTPLEFWEGLCLVKVDPGRLRREMERLPRVRAAGGITVIDDALLEKLRSIRSQMGPLVGSMRRLLAPGPATPLDAETQEMSLGFVVISGRGRETAMRWITDPARNAREAHDKIRTMRSTVETYRRALEARNAPPPAEAPPPTPEALHTPLPVEAPPPTPMPAPELPPGVDPEILEDVRRVEQCRKIFEATHQQIEVWEVFCLVILDREATASTLDRLLQFRKSGDTAAFNEGTLGLFEKLLQLRARHFRFVRGLREYLAKLPVGSFGKDTTEMALGFIVVSSRGRERAQQWLEEPGRFKQEAAGRLESIISTAMNYQTAMRNEVQKV